MVQFVFDSSGVVVLPDSRKVTSTLEGKMEWEIVHKKMGGWAPFTLQEGSREVWWWVEKVSLVASLIIMVDACGGWVVALELFI
jgi:hypothetical protein